MEPFVVPDWAAVDYPAIPSASATATDLPPSKRARKRKAQELADLEDLLARPVRLQAAGQPVKEKDKDPEPGTHKSTPGRSLTATGRPSNTMPEAGAGVQNSLASDGKQGDGQPQLIIPKRKGKKAGTQEPAVSAQADRGTSTVAVSQQEAPTSALKQRSKNKYKPAAATAGVPPGSTINTKLKAGSTASSQQSLARKKAKVAQQGTQTPPEQQRGRASARRVPPAPAAVSAPDLHSDSAVASKTHAQRPLKAGQTRAAASTSNGINPHLQGPPKLGKAQVQPAEKVAAAGGVGAKTGGKRGARLLEMMREKLQGGRFRWLNEQLYTAPGQEAFELMSRQPELYGQYHEGFRQQTKAWSVQPVDLAIAWLRDRHASLVVADFGCGDARLAASVEQTVHSLDLVATAPGVIACNMARTPLGAASVDAAVFCLSLMGTDYGSFLSEAARVLRPGGRLWIAEVRSRVAGEHGKDETGPLLGSLRQLGFTLVMKDISSKMFFVLELQKRKKPLDTDPGSIVWPNLKPCLYKRR